MEGRVIRWIKASIAKHFETKLQSTLKLYIEGEERDTNEDTDFMELRVDGPYIDLPDKTTIIFNVEINVLVQTVLDNKDNYKIERNISSPLQCFIQCIPIYRYGDGDSFFGNLKMRRDESRREDIQVNHFGIIRQDIRITQSSIEAHYQMRTYQDELNITLPAQTNLSTSLEIV